MQYEADGLECQRGQTGYLGVFIFTKDFKTDYLDATKAVLTVDEIAMTAGQKNIFFRDFL